MGMYNPMYMYDFVLFVLFWWGHEFPVDENDLFKQIVKDNFNGTGSFSHRAGEVTLKNIVKIDRYHNTANTTDHKTCAYF